ncbi:hypothetical protein Thi970DRAFT_03293 [Thiorhodovibrio frisius]|uniref:Uncharacterized protein n=1 Tax=Thiorhodovibrio frisius TaxID=631362 RepID=H8Z6K3_9GAMM|nr:hypothetical protein Thi970DRAFT_03293 [Thiorhodovibrio frisius]WPL20331.1 hypothetical protein Thiofri_00418 [Thiorhodovibrio frisius]
MDQQPIRRVIGRRQERPVGKLGAPTPAAQRWSETMAVRETRVPKGIFRYATMEEANADWERWHAELVAEMARKRRGPGE